MRVRIIPPAEDGCAFYRLREPARVLAAQGMDVAEARGLPAMWVDTAQGPQIVGCAPVDADVVVLQRTTRRDVCDVIPHLQAQGVAVVIDVDDLFSAIDPGNPAFATFHPKTDTLSNWRTLAQACRIADLVTVTTPALARAYAPHGRVAVLPNCVPQAYLHIEAAHTGPAVLGWTGTPMTHGRDLAVVGPAVADALRATGATFRALGSDATLRALGIVGEVVPWLPLDRYPAEVARLDVGIAPLADSAFNRAKSWLKGLEYAALGVPFVASPLPEYRRLADLGAGELAGRPRTWSAAMRRLLSDAAYRSDRAHAGRAAAAEWTYERRGCQWADAWERALARRRGLSTAA